MNCGTLILDAHESTGDLRRALPITYELKIDGVNVSGFPVTTEAEYITVDRSVISASTAEAVVTVTNWLGVESSVSKSIVISEQDALTVTFVQGFK